MYNKLLLYTAVLRPILTYGSPVWGYAADSNIKTLEVAQNSIIRNITSHPVRAVSQHTLAKFAGSIVVCIDIADASSGQKRKLVGRVLKEAWLACAPSLFDDFDNKDKIIQRIKDVPLSRNTMKDRILKLAENVTDQQKNDINSAPFISLCLDESIDTTKSARLAVFARYCVENIIKEELIAITSLLTTTKGTDICTAVRNSLAEKEIDLKKIV
ncbi:general transcription factor II-I repeat domain-containing protein 2A [Trichonephila clavipes]|nr:general transcription factor II-I repeat domain-containing protein 2A [Trichonephila clavipes]